MSLIQNTQSNYIIAFIVILRYFYFIFLYNFICYSCMRLKNSFTGRICFDSFYLLTLLVTINDVLKECSTRGYLSVQTLHFNCTLVEFEINFLYDVVNSHNERNYEQTPYPKNWWNKQTNPRRNLIGMVRVWGLLYAQLHKNYLNVVSFQLGTLIRFGSHL